MVVAPPLKKNSFETTAPDAIVEPEGEDEDNFNKNGDCAESTGVPSFFGAKAL